MIFNKNNEGDNEIASKATWTANHNYQHIKQALLLSKKKVLSIVDENTYILALNHYNSDNYMNEKTLDTVVSLLQSIMVNFAYYFNIQKDTVLWTNSGINVTWSDELRPATKETLNDLSASLYDDAYNFLDLLINHLNKHPNAFLDYHKSIDALKLKELLVNNTAEFSQYHNINNSDSYFFEIISTIRLQQKTIIANALKNGYLQKLTDYRLKEFELRKVIKQVANFDNLPPIAIEGELWLVTNLNEFYKYNKYKWNYYAFDGSFLLSLIQPALIYLTVYHLTYSEIPSFSKIQARQNEIEQKANFYKQKADVFLTDCIKYIEEKAQDDIIEYTSDYQSNNTFVI